MKLIIAVQRRLYSNSSTKSLVKDGPQVSNKHVTQQEKPVKDFFGLRTVTSLDVAATNSVDRLTQDDIAQKYQPLSRKPKLTELAVTYGHVRFDTDNPIKTHGQLELRHVNYSTADIKQLFVKDQIDLSDNDSSVQGSSVIGETQSRESLTTVLESFKKSTQNKNETSIIENISRQPLVFKFNHVLHQPTIERPNSHSYEENNTTQDTELHELEQHSNETAQDESKIAMMPRQDVEYNLEEEVPSLSEPPRIKQETVNAFEYLKAVRSQRIEPSNQELKRKLKTDRAYALKPDIKLDSQGFRVYNNQVPDWSKCRHIDVVKHIERSIVYHRYDILVVNKPYGIASHSEECVKGAFDMNTIVGEVMAKKFKISKVFLAHRLDKSTTGSLLFATSAERAKHLNKLFSSGEVKKTYWCITKGVPDIQHALIDMPIGEQTINGKIRGCVVRDNDNPLGQIVKQFREAKRAVTEYKVLDAKLGTALLEVKPHTGVKHQIRCHLGFGLGKPILGDHKYSDLTRYAPQKLHVPVLNALQLRQSKARTLPMHLHAKSLVITGGKPDGSTLYVNSPLSSHFRDNATTLGYRLTQDN